MRALALVTDAFGGYGGIARYNRDFLDALSAFPATDRIEVLPRYAPQPLEALPEKVVQHRARAGRIAYAAQAVQLARRLKPDLIFCGHLHLSPLASALAKGRARLLTQAHGLEVWQRPSDGRRRGVETSHSILCVSRDTRARVLTWADVTPERVRVVPNTVDEAFTPGDRLAARARLEVGDAKVVLSVSRLDGGQRHKGQDRVIRALPAVVAQGHDVRYLIAGEGEDAARLAALAAECGVAERVRFLGKTPQAELPDLYRAADVFALPSTGDGFGIVYLEAMACGTPALGLAVGGASDALADGRLGVMVGENDVALGLAKVLVSPRGDEAARYADVQARFGRAVFRDRIATVLHSIAL
jgi:phosphatidylinositol alpha-1,6-mannosyltransferase